MTGSQGEPQAALARIAKGEHPFVKFDRGDCIIFSSRTIPGNEDAVIRIQNQLAERGISLITEAPDGPIHASGHPRRGELDEHVPADASAYVVPMHGEPRHLEAHAAFAEAHGIMAVARRSRRPFVPSRAERSACDRRAMCPSGAFIATATLFCRLAILPSSQRKRLSWNGHVAVSVVMQRNGEIAAEPEVDVTGLPSRDANGLDMARARA